MIYDLFDEKLLNRNDLFVINRRMAETVEDDSSDTSTDSEEELDSPRKIVQQPTSENMDVDANDGECPS